MTFLSSLTRYLDTRRRARARRNTAALIEALPPEIQSDIGWRGFPPEKEDVARILGCR